MLLKEIIEELEPQSSPRTKKSHMKQGAKEPVFGLTVKSMKPLAKRLMKEEKCQQIAYDLYDTGNYDLMYLAGMIVDPHLMSEDKYKEWLEKAYFYMISDYIVSVCLSETEIAWSVADKWMDSDQDLTMSAGYSTYSWMLARRSDDLFKTEAIRKKLGYINNHIKTAPNRTRYSMYYFVYNVGVSYIELHDEALKISKLIGDISIDNHDGTVKVYNAYNDINKEIERNRIGFKRKYVRC